MISTFLDIFPLIGAGLHNGQWHFIYLLTKKNRVTLMVDNEAMSTSHMLVPMHIFSGDTYYFGGEIYFIFLLNHKNLSFEKL